MSSFGAGRPEVATKMLLLGDTGAGKTGSLASLIAAGYTVRILDLDRGTEILNDYLTNPNSMYVKDNPGRWKADPAGLLKRASYVTITDSMQITQNGAVPKGDAWGKINRQLGEWKEDNGANYGNVGTWGAKDVLVIDSLSRDADAALSFQLVMNGRAMTRPELGDWLQAQILIERQLKLLYSDDVKCNVIVMAHINYIEGDSGISRGYPQTVGKALSPKIGQFFNHALLLRSTGQGANAKRTLHTNTFGVIDLKNTAPLRVKSEYPIDTGLADYFADVRTGSTSAPAPATISTPVKA